jgi:hydroxymethylpyrimidine/phosphomethylpyrimidine kinase
VIFSHYFITTKEVKMDERDLVLGNMLRAVRLIEDSHSFAFLIPEVRTNLVYALKDAKSIEDVVGIEGRITVVNGFPYASGFPKFGGSSHMARFVIEIMRVNPEMRAGIDFIYNNEFGKWLKEYCEKNNLILSCIDRAREPEERKKRKDYSTPWKVKEAIRSVNGRIPDIAYEIGAIGKEDLSFLLARSAIEAARLAIKIADEYRKK